MSADVIVAAGNDQSFLQQGMLNGSPFTGFTSGDPNPTVQLWGGGKLAVFSPAPTATWVTEDVCLYTLNVPAAVSTAMGEGIWEYRVSATVSGLTPLLNQGRIRVIPGPGTAAALPVYCSLGDCLKNYTPLETLRRPYDEQSFNPQRNQVWSDINLYLIERYNPQMNRRRTDGPPTTWIPNVGTDIPDLTTAPPSAALIRSSLAAGGLVLPVPDDQVLSQIAACLTIATILNREISGSRNSNPYADAADFFYKQGMDRLATYRAYVDLNDDDVPDVLIDRDCIFLNGWGLP
jgi:hypothetical protein